MSSTYTIDSAKSRSHRVELVVDGRDEELARQFFAEVAERVRDDVDPAIMDYEHELRRSLGPRPAGAGQS